jgi:peptidylprolyl isomerase
MKISPSLFCLAGSLAISAQTAQKPATAAAKPATAHPAALAVKLPPGVPPVAGSITTAFSLKYQEVKIGTGPEALPFKVYKVFYTGYRAADGVKFDSPDDHREPILGADGKPEVEADGKVKMGPPEPLAFPQGRGKLIPGFELGILGMRVGGKRRLFIPWQLAYGTKDIADQPAKDGQPAHRGIPPKSDLIFDIELVDVSEPPPPQPPRTPGGSGSPATQPQSSQPPQPQQ